MAMELRALFLLPLCFPGLQGQAPGALRRREGDTLYVQCPYAPWTTDSQTKCWCLLKDGRCQELVNTYSKQSRDRRIIINDDSTTETVSVTMVALKAEDSGTYFCAIYKSYYDYPRLRTISLIVFRGTQQLTAKESGKVSVQCHYKIAEHSTASKAWCKQGEGKTCSVLATTRSESPAANSTAQEGVRIQDDTQQGIVTVTMEQLQVQDSGVYWCALQDGSGLLRMEEVTLSISKALPPGAFPDSGSQSQDVLLGDSCSGNTFLILSVVLLLLLLLALLTCIALGVRYYRLLLRTGIREAEDTSDRAEGTAQPGSTGRRESSQDDSKGPAYINLDVQSSPSPEDPLYCNVELSQAPRNPQHVEYAIIAFNPPPRASRE
uniref:Uncharacterized LOC103823355 n=1 Tax=Serinus canaria TaxID=9135 RepID=A0A8C9NWV8_SERCA